MKKFIKICKKNQKQLKSYLVDVLVSAGYKPVVEDGFIYAKEQNVPVLLTAHMDTVHKEKVRNIVIEGNRISSPQGIGGDDRCGIYIIYKIITKTNLRPAILFCEDEEIGGVGSDKFTTSKISYELDNLKFLVELDRANATEAVYYSCGNEEFKSFVEKATGYKESWGTFSDICNLSPECGLASVNLSCGYYKAHTTDEYVVFDEMENTIDAVIDLLDAALDDEVKKFDYMEEKYSYLDDYDYGWGLLRNQYKYTRNYKDIVIIWTEGNDQFEDVYTAINECEALGMFFMDHKKVRYVDVISYYEEFY